MEKENSIENQSGAEKRLRTGKLEPLAERVVAILGILIFALLSITSLIFTRYFPADYSGEIPYNRVDFFVFTAALALVIGILAMWLGRVLLRYEKAVLAVVLLWMLLAGVLWIGLAKSSPISDQGMLYTSAQRFLEGNYGRLEYGKYLYYYPFQLGMVAYESVILKLFGLERYQALQLMNVLGSLFCVYSGYRITGYLSRKKEAGVVYLLLMAVCFPLIVYTVYVYGDVLAAALSMGAVWQFLRYIREGRKSGAMWLMVLLAAAILLRNNCLITMIALICILGVRALAGKNWKYFGVAAVLLVACLGSGRLIRQYYEQKSGIAVNDGMPSILWIAMGMQEGDKEAGWYNGYSMYVYQDECRYDSGTAGALGLAEVKSRAKEFLKNPAYGADFYFRKFTSQWNEPTYGCFIMTNATEEERSALGESLYTGLPNRILEKFMDAYQLLIYGAVLYLLISEWKEKRGLEWYALLIAIIGGVLFHELWEAKSRYVLPYFIMMIPMAAAGLTELGARVKRWRTKDETSEGGR